MVGTRCVVRLIKLRAGAGTFFALIGITLGTDVVGKTTLGTDAGGNTTLGTCTGGEVSCGGDVVGMTVGSCGILIGGGNGRALCKTCAICFIALVVLLPNFKEGMFVVGELMMDKMSSTDCRR